MKIKLIINSPSWTTKNNTCFSFFDDTIEVSKNLNLGAFVANVDKFADRTGDNVGNIFLVVGTFTVAVSTKVFESDTSRESGGSIGLLLLKINDMLSPSSGIELVREWVKSRIKVCARDKWVYPRRDGSQGCGCALHGEVCVLSRELADLTSCVVILAV